MNLLGKSNMNFTKLQGLGNDFILVDARRLDIIDWLSISESMCNRRFGIGADGLLLLMDSQSADFRMRMFNPDGSEAEACGNGLRCIVRFIVEHNLNSRKILLIETMAGIRRAKLIKQAGTRDKIQVSMGKPEFALAKIPVAIELSKGSVFDIMLGDYPLRIEEKDLKLNFVSMGNPHAVFITDSAVNDFPLLRIGPQVEKNTIFPRGVNFEVAQVVASDKIEMRVWERGVGETLACGSGACAVAVAAQLLKMIGNTVEIKLPGGLAEVSWDGKSEVWLTGPAEIVFTGNWLGIT
jgi:diaminopimelate epimerase